MNALDALAVSPKELIRQLIDTLEELAVNGCIADSDASKEKRWKLCAQAEAYLTVMAVLAAPDTRGPVDVASVATPIPGYAEPVRELEQQGLTTSDAQGVADAELITTTTTKRGN